MSIYIELLLVAVVVIFIVDISGWTDTWLGWLSKFTTKYGRGPVRDFPPFTCSLCMTWWCCLAWLLIRGQFTLPLVAYSAGLATFSNTIQNLCISIREVLNRLLLLIERWIMKD